MDAVVFVLTVGFLVPLLMSYLAPLVDPRKVIWFAFAGLGASVIYMANVVLMLYWALRWKIMAPVVLFFLLVGAGNVSKFVRPGFSKHYADKRVPGSLRILSYNVGSFDSAPKGGGRDHSYEICSFIRDVDPDIICLQECDIFRANRSNIDSLLAGWQYRSTSFAPSNGAGYGRGVAIFSKYPIRNPQVMDYPGTNNASMWADIVVRKDTLRIFTNHLQTTGINQRDRDFISPEGLVDFTSNERAMGIARKLKRNFMMRADQADAVSDVIHDGTRKVIVCGDFNDTPMSYTYRTMKGNLVDTFRKKGRGMGATYKELFGILRIDYIFHSRDFETVSYNLAGNEWSDHDPVVVEVKLK